MSAGQVQGLRASFNSELACAQDVEKAAGASVTAKYQDAQLATLTWQNLNVVSRSNLRTCTATAPRISDTAVT